VLDRSSSLLGKIAAGYGIRYVETLTGFKWIGRVPDLVFGYEEALGYCVDPEAVKDKERRVDPGPGAATRCAREGGRQDVAGSAR